jgi:Zn-dependent protease with chaperone function
MKQQVIRLSPHQNGKVFAVLMAVSSLVFVFPFMLLVGLAAPPQSGPPLLVLVLLPLFYLVLGYIMVAVACWIYNRMFRFVGGIEFEARSADA